MGKCEQQQLGRRTLALERRVREIEATLGVGGGTPSLLVVDLMRPGFPHRVLRDAVLEPVDKVVWMVLRASGARGRLAERGGGTGCARFPRYARIARLANVGSKSTVSRSIAILRAERWLSLCVAGPAVGRSLKGCVFGLHDKPLPLADAVYLDAGYPGWLRGSHSHPHRRVREVVRGVLASAEAQSLWADVEPGKSPGDCGD